MSSIVKVFHWLYYFPLVDGHLFQFFKCAIWMILNKILTPFRDTILKSETKQVDNVNLHSFTISFIGLLKYSTMSIRVSLTYVGYCNFLYGNLVTTFGTSCIASR
jgi:uncharacterized protein with PQ loop repeat